MRILFVDTNIGYGGACKMIAFVANSLAQQKHDVTFLTYRNDEVLQELHEGVKHIHFPWEQDESRSIPTLIRTIKSLHKYLKQEKFECAVAFLSPSQLRLAFASLFTNTKTIFSQRGDPYTYSGNKRSPLYILNQAAFALADGYVFQTQKAKAYYSKRIQSRGTIIANPIDQPPEGLLWDIAKAKKKIVSVGRMDLFQKRQDVLIAAFDKFSKEYPEYSLHFYGDGEDSEKIEQIAGSNDRIVFHGAVSNVLSHIVDARMFVMTSDFEGIPNALLEAMAIGLPCISTDCSPGGAALLIENQVNGLLVPCGDSEAVYLAMKKYAQDEATSVVCGKNAEMVTERYSKQRIVDQWENFIKDTLEKGKPIGDKMKQ